MASLYHRSFSCSWRQSPNNIRLSVLLPWAYLSCWGFAAWWGVLLNSYLRLWISPCNCAFSCISRFCSCKNFSTIFWVSLSEFVNVCLALLYLVSSVSVIMARESHKTAKYQVLRTETDGVVRNIWCAYRLWSCEFEFHSLMARCVRYNIMWSSLSVIFDKSEIFSDFLHWNIVESGIKTHSSNYL